MKNIIISISVLILVGGIMFLVLRQNHEKSNTDLTGYTFVSSITKKDGSQLGDVYVKYINKDIFTSLYIVDKTPEHKIMYVVNQQGFFNQVDNNSEIPVISNIYGWKLSVATESIQVNIVDSTGKDISDNITIYWNYEKNAFEVFKS